MEGHEVECRGKEEAREPDDDEHEPRPDGDSGYPGPSARDQRCEDQAEQTRRQHRLTDDGRSAGARSLARAVSRRERDRQRDGRHDQPAPAMHCGQAPPADDRHRTPGKADHEADGEETGADLFAMPPENERDDEGGRHDVTDEREERGIDRTGEVGRGEHGDCIPTRSRMRRYALGSRQSRRTPSVPSRDGPSA